MSAAKKSTAKKTTAKKAAARTTTPKAPARKTSTAKKTTAKKTTAKKTTAKKTTAKKTVAKKTTAKKATAKKTTAKKTVAKKTTAKKTTAKKTTAKKTVAKKTTAEPAARRPLPPRKPVKKTPAPRPARRIKLDAAALAAVRERLENERSDYERQLKELENDSFNESQSEISGDAGLNEDFADAGTATFDRERDLSIRNNVLDLIDQVTRALERIDEGTYGTCERCGRPIDAARIKAFPRVLLCLDCKRREERIR
jgi:RNA polymerase-binding transcription factor DksA